MRIPCGTGLNVGHHPQACPCWSHSLGWEDNTGGIDVELSLPHLCQSVLCPIQRWIWFQNAVIYLGRTTLNVDQPLSELHMLQVFPLALEQGSDIALDKGQVHCGWKHSVLSHSARKRNCHQRAHEKNVISTPWPDSGPWAKNLNLPGKKDINHLTIAAIAVAAWDTEHMAG